MANFNAQYFGNGNGNSGNGGGGNGNSGNGGYGPNYFSNSGGSGNSGNSGSGNSGNGFLSRIFGGVDGALGNQDRRFAGIIDGALGNQDRRFAGMMDSAFERHNRCLWDSAAYKVFAVIVTILVGLALFWVFTHEPFLVKEVVNGNTVSSKWDIVKLIAAGVLDLGVLITLIGIGAVTRRR